MLTSSSHQFNQKHQNFHLDESHHHNHPHHHDWYHHYWVRPPRPYIPVPVVINKHQPYPVYQPIPVQQYPQQSNQPSLYSSASICLNKWSTIRVVDGRNITVFITSVSENSVNGLMQNGQQITLFTNQIINIIC